MGLCSDSTSYYRVCGPCLDFKSYSLWGEKALSVLVGMNSSSSNQDKVGPSSNQDRVGVGLRHTRACPNLIMIGRGVLPIIHLKNENENEQK